MCCERSFWHWTTMPVGMCVMRTAESVVLTCWPPLPPETVGVDLEVVRADVDRNIVVDFGIDEDGGERRVPPLGGVVRGDAHEAVDARLLAEIAEDVVALEPDGGALEPGLFSRLVVEDLGLEALALGVAQVHPQQHLGPVLGLGAAGPGMDGQDGVAGIVRVVEQGPQLRFLEGLCRAGRRPPRCRLRRSPPRPPARRGPRGPPSG